MQGCHSSSAAARQNLHNDIRLIADGALSRRCCGRPRRGGCSARVIGNGGDVEKITQKRAVSQRPIGRSAMLITQPRNVCFWQELLFHISLWNGRNVPSPDIWACRDHEEPMTGFETSIWNTEWRLCQRRSTQTGVLLSGTRVRRSPGKRFTHRRHTSNKTFACVIRPMMSSVENSSGVQQSRVGYLNCCTNAPRHL